MQDLKDEITLNEKSRHVCRGYYQDPSGGLAECLSSIARQAARRIPKYAAIGTAALRQQLQESAEKVRLDAENVLRKARRGY